MDYLPQITFTKFNQKNRSPNKIDTEFVSFFDFERIKNNRIISEEEEIQKIESILNEQEKTKLVKENTLKGKIKK